MSDRDVPTLRFTTAALMQRLLGPMQRVLRVACDDLGVTPVGGIGLEGAKGETVDGPERERPEEAMDGRIGAPGPREHARVASPRPLAATTEPFAAPPGRLASTTKDFTASSGARLGAAGLDLVALRPTTEGSAATTTSSAVAGRIRLRPRPPAEAAASRRSPSSESVGQPLSPSVASPTTEKVRLRAQAPREHLAAPSAAPPSPSISRAHDVPTVAIAATRSIPEPEPLVHAAATPSPRTAARVLVPVVEAPPAHVRNEAPTHAEAPRSSASWTHAPQDPSAPFGPSRTEAAPPSAPALALGEQLSFANASSSSLALASPPPGPPAAPSHAPAPRVVSLEALGPSTAFGPSSALSEHALAAVIAAAARRHGIDT